MSTTFSLRSYGCIALYRNICCISINGLFARILAVTLLTILPITNLFSATPDNTVSIPAFPGAEGFGSQTAGGRAGKVYLVDTLASSGPGSLRDALEKDGPRIVVFNIGGIIDLGTRDIVVRNPYLTIAGQTAPGNGIVIKNAGLVIATHDVIIQGMRFRIGGDTNGSNPRYRDGLEITNSACTDQNSNCEEKPHNIIIDHNSISWAVDENFSTWAGVHDITLSWNIISEGLACSIHTNGCHSMGLLLGPESHNISIHHNIFAHNGERNPQIYNGNTLEFINNLVYDWTVAATMAGGCSYKPTKGSRINLIGNYYQPGPSTFAYTEDSHTVDKSILISSCWNESKIYLHDNLGPRLGYADNVSDWVLAKNETYNTIKSDTPALPLSGVTTSPVLDAYKSVLAGAGAVAPERDLVDIRVVEEIRSQSGHLIDSVEKVEGWLNYETVTSKNIDRDNDGLPDSWENNHGLNADNPDDAAYSAENSEYTNIEQYIHFRLFNKIQADDAIPESIDSGETIGINGKQGENGGAFIWLSLLLGVRVIFKRRTINRGKIDQ